MPPPESITKADSETKDLTQDENSKPSVTGSPLTPLRLARATQLTSQAAAHSAPKNITEATESLSEFLLAQGIANELPYPAATLITLSVKRLLQATHSANVVTMTSLLNADGLPSFRLEVPMEHPTSLRVFHRAGWLSAPLEEVFMPNEHGMFAVTVVPSAKGTERALDNPNLDQKKHPQNTVQSITQLQFDPGTRKVKGFPVKSADTNTFFEKLPIPKALKWTTWPLFKAGIQQSPAEFMIPTEDFHFHAEQLVCTQLDNLRSYTDYVNKKGKHASVLAHQEHTYNQSAMSMYNRLIMVDAALPMNLEICNRSPLPGANVLQVLMRSSIQSKDTYHKLFDLPEELHEVADKLNMKFFAVRSARPDLSADLTAANSQPKLK